MTSFVMWHVCSWLITNKMRLFCRTSKGLLQIVGKHLVSNCPTPPAVVTQVLVTLRNVLYRVCLAVIVINAAISVQIFTCLRYLPGNRGGTVVKVLCYKSEGQWFDPSWCHWIFYWHKILPIALWPWGRLSLWQKWVPGVFRRGKGGRCVRLTTYHHPVPLSRNLRTLTSWNPLTPSGPLTGLLYLYILTLPAWLYPSTVLRFATFAVHSGLRYRI